MALVFIMKALVNIDSFTIWNYKTCWVHLLIIRSKQIALQLISTKKFKLFNKMVLGMVTHEIFLKTL